MPSSKRLFAGRLFTTRVFVPALFRGVGTTVALVYGPACWSAGDVFHPGFKEGDSFSPGFQEGEVNHPGFKAGQRFC